MSARHDFVTWAMLEHGKADTPLGDFARELNRSWEFPRTGDHAALRESLVESGADSWVLTCFDVAWEQYQANASEELL